MTGGVPGVEREKDGEERLVAPANIAATIYHHMGVPLEATYLDHPGRPRYTIENGEPIRELSPAIKTKIPTAEQSAWRIQRGRRSGNSGKRGETRNNNPASASIFPCS